MNLTKRRENYRSILEGDKCVYPGSVYDPISARIAEDLGFEVGMFAGSIASATVLGAPDIIVLTMTEFAQQIHSLTWQGNDLDMFGGQILQKNTHLLMPGQKGHILLCV